MPPVRLNRDLLIDVIKELLKKDNQNAVLRFGLSGRQPLEALYDMLESATSLELNDDYYSIGWGNKQCSKFFHYAAEKSYIHLLMHCRSVNKLRLNCGKKSSMEYYQPFLDKIANIQQITSLSIPRSYNVDNTTNFVLKISSTIKEFDVNPLLMTDSVRDCLILEKLTILNSNDVFFFKFCPQTDTVIFKNPDEQSTIQAFNKGYREFFSKFRDHASPFLSSIKEWIFDDKIGNVKDLFENVSLTGYRNIFSSLEHIKSIMTKPSHFENHEKFITYHIKRDIRQWQDAIKEATKIPIKLTYVINIDENFGDKTRFDFYNEIFTDFEFDDTVNGYYCFRQFIQSAGAESVLLEVQVNKNDEMPSIKNRSLISGKTRNQWLHDFWADHELFDL